MIDRLAHSTSAAPGRTGASSLRRRLDSDLPLVLATSVFSSFVVLGPFALRGHFDGDTLRAYSFFYDNLDSLNRFGVPAWWAPHLNMGGPNYFYGILGIPSLGKPAFAFTGLIAWALGRAGFELPSVYPLYVFCFGFLIPFLFLVGVWAVARQLFRSRTAIRYVSISAAFSPGILVNLSNPGLLENTAYGLFCTAAYLRFVARPGPSRFALLAVTGALVSIAVSQTALVTATPMLLALLAASIACSRPARSAIRTISPSSLLLALVLIAVTAAPSVLTFVQQRDQVTHAELDSLDHSYGELKAGNPLQFLTASVPGIAYDWSLYRQSSEGPPAEYRIRSLGGGEIGSNYLGILAMPLAAIGLAFGRRRVRQPLFVMLVGFATVLVLYPASPFFAPILVTVAPLRTLNHFGDVLFPAGGFLLLLFAAGLGLEAAERNPALLRRLVTVFVGSNAIVLPLYLRWGDAPAGLGGFAAAIAATTAIVAIWASRLPRRSRTRLLGTGLLVLTLIDVATVGFWVARATGGEAVRDRAADKGIGNAEVAPTRIAAMLTPRPIERLLDAGVRLDALPSVAGYCMAHFHATEASAEDVASASRGVPASLGFPDRLRDDSKLAAFLETPPNAPCDTRIRPRGDYNSIRLEVDAARAAIVFVRDAYAPQWRATVNGAAAEIYPALGAFKAVIVPPGRSRVELCFEPPFLGTSLAIAYAAWLGSALWAWRARTRPG